MLIHKKQGPGCVCSNVPVGLRKGPLIPDPKQAEQGNQQVRRADGDLPCWPCVVCGDKIQIGAAEQLLSLPQPLPDNFLGEK